MKPSIENIASGSIQALEVETDFTLLRLDNAEDRDVLAQYPVKQGLLQVHCCLKGNARFLYNQGAYAMEVPAEQSLLLYNPQTTLPMEVVLAPGTRMLSLLIPIRSFHALFSAEADTIPFLNPDYKDKKYYQQNPISPSLSVVLSQLWNQHMHPSVIQLYHKAKVYEWLSLYFNRNTDPQAEQCPFLVDEDNLGRIRRAKEIVIERMAEPPSLKDLAAEIGLPLKKLKEGFKQIYGDSVYSFLFDYKMEMARKMLETGKYNVNEVGLKVGYSTASHFIAAFRKKYHTTPKKYLLSLAQPGR
ncbi:AraC family transcriptional regulator [Robiginitalea sp. M366]|uniref:helix-turn-helix transcriptional regulator n=1 Tax=Robiginitalea aestuariiviva TaxID=3036903 RepID=UPI00240DF38F|nr:AraC family transcriptional regulator [Robiginitalea aestuariiviva]MDG1571382.1 AraC family transcriptional regulator [Robiginitalea aestuariiviva]